MFDFSIVTNWIHELLLSIMPEGVAVFIECVAIGVHRCIICHTGYHIDLHGAQSLRILPMPSRSEPCR